MRINLEEQNEETWNKMKTPQSSTKSADAFETLSG